MKRRSRFLTRMLELLGGRPPGFRVAEKRRYTVWSRGLGALAVVLGLAPPLLVLAGEAPANQNEGGDEGEHSLLNLVVKGGPVMIPIALCSLVAVAVACERFVGLRRSRIIPDGFMAGLADAFGHSGTDLENARAYCRRTPSPISNVIDAGIGKLGRKLEIVEKAVEDAAAREVFRMKRGLEALSVIGSISPLLGLLGTIYGMIGAFRTAADKGLGRAETLATGIYEALVTTAAGLTVAVPTLLVYYVLLTKTERLTEQIEQIGSEFLDQCHEGPAAAGSAAESKGPVRAEQWGPRV